jgi:hypothetical protein
MQTLVLNFRRFKLESTPMCTADFVQIHDGLSLSARIIGRYCGMTMPNNGVVNTTHNVAVIWFHSDNSINFDGFDLVWNSLEPSTSTVALKDALCLTFRFVHGVHCSVVYLHHAGNLQDQWLCERTCVKAHWSVKLVPHYAYIIAVMP